MTEAERAALWVAATEFIREVRRYDTDFSFELPSERSAGVLADVCAASLIVDTDVRQHLLEELSMQRLSLGDKSRVLH